jgi:hypothetical protein
MSEPNEPFSRRFGYSLETEIAIRHEAPPDLRFALLALAYRGGMSWRDIVTSLTRALLIAPEGNWSERNLEEEARRIINTVRWHEVYDAAEAIYLRLRARGEAEFYDKPPEVWFEGELNRFFVERGIGWQMVEGAVQFRGPGALEDEGAAAIEALQASGRTTSASELREARRDLSRRPEPDTTGTIQHSLAALECLAREITGEPNRTFGDILNRNPNLLRSPLDGAMHKLWGFASQAGRHIREGGAPTVPEAVLVFGIVSASIAFMLESERIETEHET